MLLSWLLAIFSTAKIHSFLLSFVQISPVLYTVVPCSVYSLHAGLDLLPYIYCMQKCTYRYFLYTKKSWSWPFCIAPPPPLPNTTRYGEEMPIWKRSQAGVCHIPLCVWVCRAGIFKQSMGARNRVGIGLSYQPARLHRLAEFIPWNRSIPGLHKRLKVRAQYSKRKAGGGGGSGRREGAPFWWHKQTDLRTLWLITCYWKENELYCAVLLSILVWQ